MSGPEPADVTLPQGRGPILVRGPVTIRLPDGTVVSSERPTVALCTCLLSERYPFCDTSHRSHRSSHQSSQQNTQQSSHQNGHQGSQRTGPQRQVRSTTEGK